MKKLIIIIISIITLVSADTAYSIVNADTLHCVLDRTYNGKTEKITKISDLEQIISTYRVSSNGKTIQVNKIKYSYIESSDDMMVYKNTDSKNIVYTLALSNGRNAKSNGGEFFYYYSFSITDSTVDIWAQGNCYVTRNE